MVKQRNVEPTGEVKVFSKEKIQRTEPITVSYSKAKELTRAEKKKVLSAAQSEHVQKLVEANRLKWEAKRQEKERAKEEAIKREAEALKEKIANEEVVEVIVKPKRVYPPRKKTEETVPVAPVEVPQKKKKIVYVEESESDVDTEEVVDEEVEIVKKVVKKKPAPKQDTSRAIQEVEKINAVIANAQPVNRYASLLRW